MPFQAITFDLDGTLLYTLEDIAHSANYILNKYGFPTHKVNDYQDFVGDGVYMLVQRALPESHRNEKLIQDMIDDFALIYDQRWKNNTRPYPGIQEILKELNKRSFKLAILSNKPDKFTQLCVQEFFPSIHFDLVLGHKDNLPLKPDPALSEFLLKSLQSSPGKTLFVGDSGVDVKTAINGGMIPAGVLWGYRDRKELEENGARFLFDKPSDIIDLIDNKDWKHQL